MTNQLEKLQIKNFRGPLPLNQLAYSGGQPTAEQLEKMAELGIATVINLRPNTEIPPFNEAELVRKLNLNYVQVEIASAADLTLKNINLFADALAQATDPLFLHCAGGNRVGALLALKAYLIDGKDKDSALQLGADAGLTGLQADVISLLDTLRNPT